MPMSPSDPKRGASLARLVAIFAATFVVSIGICGFSMHIARRDYPNTLGFLSLIGMLGSLVALIVIGLMAVSRTSR